MNYQFDKTRLRTTSVYKKTLARINSDFKRYDDEYVKTQIYCNAYTDKFETDPDNYYGRSKYEVSAEETAEALMLAQDDFLNKLKGEKSEEEEARIAEQERWSGYTKYLMVKVQAERARSCGKTFNEDEYLKERIS